MLCKQTLHRDRSRLASGESGGGGRAAAGGGAGGLAPPTPVCACGASALLRSSAELPSHKAQLLLEPGLGNEAQCLRDGRLSDTKAAKRGKRSAKHRTQTT